MKKKLKMLFFTFLKIGLFTFGGGYAMIPLIEETCVEKKKWINHDEMMDITIIAEATPGPIAINCATYVGYKTSGFPGAVVSTLGVMLPSLVIIFLISLFLDKFLEITIIASAFKGIKVCVGILILLAGIKLSKKIKKNLFRILVFFTSAVTVFIIGFFSISFSTLYIIIVFAFISLIYYSVAKKEGDSK